MIIKKNLKVFTFLEEKYGQGGIKLARVIEKLDTKIEKIKCDIKYLLICKRNKLTPVFARPKIDFRTRNKITRQIIEAVIHKKYRKKKSLLRQLIKLKTFYIVELVLLAEYC